MSEMSSVIAESYLHLSFHECENVHLVIQAIEYVYELLQVW